MHDDIGLRFRKVKEVSFHQNSVRNLVLRQRFAMALLQEAQTKTRLINIDETWQETAIKIRMRAMEFTESPWRSVT